MNILQSKKHQSLLELLLKFNTKKKRIKVNYSLEEIIEICQETTNILLTEPNILKLKSPIIVVGDIHGNFNDLIKIFESCGYPPTVNYLFLGDYIDRGKNNVEVIVLLFILKINYPNSIYLLRGNHEDEQVCICYGFFDECKKFTTKQKLVFDTFTKTFDCLPIAAIIEDKAFCIHGGISPKLNSLDTIINLQRPIKIQPNSLINDLLWSDPFITECNGWETNPRGRGYLYGKDKVEEFLSKYNYDIIIRGHQVFEKGYKHLFNNHLLSLFSCSNPFSTSNNSFAILLFDSKLNKNIKTFKIE
ncbi:hypothetical protein ENUP19_0353G0035 [Entamoeba nuttalli]|uniref:Serine/threonine-protein phosphatase n=2 Tax=Entamoeba nuttalli TaxID=412467 RepID=K2GBZ6_ENTNP|nr:serine/threonine protein phosphatase PP1, putative [Entamoeba nuttalli P19]EKE40071.1 serine/threonine protein phosphatase PP1, putative [Entamoeba nuttalli P19]|eukprot:XP_008857594.1 serine/threonine protein phosphatase PP1, putative [Entamoeba nuttalli P19]